MNKYKLPPEIENLGRRGFEAAQRRKALRQAGCTTYALGMKGGSQAIVCLCCGLGSSHPDDIEKRYCGFCQQHHDDPPANPAPPLSAVQALPAIIKAAGAEGVWLLRGAKSVVMGWVDNEEATDPLQIELANAEIVLLARFPVGDDKPAGIEYW
ncbi:MAG: hypothetical protein KF770_17565 [Anaerolineae bacterium]|nr:hypothetical protein [Anaerolineae bacterium]